MEDITLKEYLEIHINNLGVRFVIISIAVIVLSFVYIGYLQIRDYNCSDFNSHNQAQAFFDSHPDKYGLDRDGDGLACE